jgi:hypothetical protein
MRKSLKVGPPGIKIIMRGSARLFYPTAAWLLLGIPPVTRTLMNPGLIVDDRGTRQL